MGPRFKDTTVLLATRELRVLQRISKILLLGNFGDLQQLSGKDVVATSHPFFQFLVHSQQIYWDDLFIAPAEDADDDEEDAPTLNEERAEQGPTATSMTVAGNN